MSNRPGPLAQRIAAEIRAELGRQNHSRRWLASQIDESHVTVSRWVNGDGPMSFDSLDAICEALGITVSDVLAAVEHTNTTPAPRTPRIRRTSIATIDRPDNSRGTGGHTHGHHALARLVA
jgi:DNA-binding Xre family transcriptional regulator